MIYHVQRCELFPEILDLAYSKILISIDIISGSKSAYLP